MGMYPERPGTAADLVPLPLCQGPKLDPFPFEGPQEIDFLEHLDEGAHGHVFKVTISERIYALKLFKFVRPFDWAYATQECLDRRDVEEMRIFYNYDEPFNRECRAYGRIQEAGYNGKIAGKCFGYVLLDEKHEQAMMKKLRDIGLDFFNEESPDEDMFRSPEGRAPPIRGIVKEFGHGPQEDFSANSMQKVLDSIIKMQQLGIIRFDLGSHQLINGKLADLSLTSTTPHYIMTPTMVPEMSKLSPECLEGLEVVLFRTAINDLSDFDDMVFTWNVLHRNGKKGKKPITKRAFPASALSGSWKIPYNLRSTPRRERVFTLVDPRLYDWKIPFTATGPAEANDDSAGGDRQRPASSAKVEADKSRKRVVDRPPRWYFNGNEDMNEELKRFRGEYCHYSFDIKDGLIHPVLRDC